MTVHVLYENPDWLPPLTEALASRGLEARTWFVDGGVLDLAEAPPDGVWVNRMSPSAHTRGHQRAVGFTREWLGHLEAHGRRVLNGTAAFALEVSKLRQDTTLRAAGIDTPHTIGVFAREDLAAAARKLGGPFLTKHNQGGKGLGVRLFRHVAAFEAWLADAPDDAPELASPDGITVLQRYVEPKDAFVTRVEIVGGRFQYAIRSSTAEGFELCPADACQVPDSAHCPVGGTGKFALREEITADDPLVRRYVAYCAAHGLDVAGIEFVEDAAGRRFTYDVNANSNYNSGVESTHGLHGMGAVADLCADALQGAVAAK